jgi:hypothetical protein
LLSLVGTRTGTIRSHHRIGVSLKLIAVAVLSGLLGAEAALPPLALAGGLALVLAFVVFVERTLIPLEAA